MHNVSQRVSLRLSEAPPERSVRALPTSQFTTLARHFAKQILSFGSEGEEPEIGVIGLLAILATPGIFYSLFLFEKYSTFLRFLRGGPLHMDVYTESLPEKYLLITSSMALTAMVVAIKWDRILPGPQDYAILAPMPVGVWTIFAANACALGFLVSLFVLALNTVSTVLFPFIVLSDENAGLMANLQFVLVHVICVALASVFAFSACLGLLALMMLLLPPAVFKRASPGVQLGIFFFACLLLATAAMIPTLLQHPADTLLLRFLPPAWFVSLYQCLQGRGSPLMSALARSGLIALLAAVCLAAVTFVLSYHRSFVRVPESSSAPPLSTGRAWEAISKHARHFVNLFAGRGGFDRAIYWFAIRVLLRSEAHFLTIGCFITIGMVIGMTSISTAISPANIEPFLRLCLMVEYSAVAGLRVSLAIPAGQRSSWIYSLCTMGGDVRPVLRKVFITAASIVVVVPAALIAGFAISKPVGVLHGCYLLFIGTLLTDCFLINVRRIPFMSAFPNLRDNTVLLVAVNLLALFVFSALAAKLESAMLRNGWLFASLPVLLLLWCGLIRRIHASPAEPAAPGGSDTSIQTLGIG